MQKILRAESALVAIGEVEPVRKRATVVGCEGSPEGPTTAVRRRHAPALTAAFAWKAPWPGAIPAGRGYSAVSFRRAKPKAPPTACCANPAVRPQGLRL